MNPLVDIEDKKAWTDFGRQAYLLFKGATDEGASVVEAISLVSAFYEGIFRSIREEDNEG